MHTHQDIFPRPARSRAATVRFTHPQGSIRKLARLKARRPAESRARYAPWKRVLDFHLSVIALPAVAIATGFCCILIWLEDRGPVLYRQQRTGLAGRRFTMFKLRTMYRDADKRKESLAHLNQHSWPDFKIPQDPRITKVGRLLRRTSLDELPQIINVLLGDMSFVGPRPTSFKHSTYDLTQTERLEVLPGITGLWQIGGRSDISFEDRVELDLQYVNGQSLALDLHILYRTIAAVFAGTGAA